jgi:hypothetical protein
MPLFGNGARGLLNLVGRSEYREACGARSKKIEPRRFPL